MSQKYKKCHIKLEFVHASNQVMGNRKFKKIELKFILHFVIMSTFACTEYCEYSILTICSCKRSLVTLLLHRDMNKHARAYLQTSLFIKCRLPFKHNLLLLRVSSSPSSNTAVHSMHFMFTATNK